MTAEELAQIIERCGQQWLLEGNREEKLGHLLRKLNDAYAVFDQRFRDDDEITLDDGVVQNEMERHKIVALLQSLSRHSPEFIAGIWRIIQGDRIASVRMEYASLDSFQLCVGIESEQGRRTRDMKSGKVEDAAFLRHVSIGRVNDKPFFAGYFALRSP